MHHAVIIIGSGPAGLTAAIYLSRAKFAPLVFAGSERGGQLMSTTDVGNFPGFEEDILGPELMRRMQAQAQRFGSVIVDEEVISVDFSQKPLSVTTNKQSYTADAIIIATGASARWLGLESEQRLRGKGVSACATCDGFFFKNKRVAVVGGGDTAMEDANVLTKFAEHVTVIHRSEALAASKFMQERTLANPKITVLYNTEVADVLGDTVVTGVRIRNRKTKEESEIPLQGLFIAIGHKPNTDFLVGQIDLERGYVKVTDQTKTNIKGVFACGDVHDYRYRQAITAAGSGCMAALDVERYLLE